MPTNEQYASALNAALNAGAFSTPSGKAAYDAAFIHSPASSPLTSTGSSPATAPLTSSGTPDYSQRIKNEQAGQGFYSQAEIDAANKAARDQIQSRIDAINAAKQAEINRIREATQANLTTEGAISARRGLSGSSFAEGRSNEVQHAGAIQEGDAERKAALEIAGIQAQADKDAQDRLDKKREALANGSDALIKFNQNQRTLKLQQVAAALFERAKQGQDIHKIDENAYAKLYGLDANDIAVAQAEAYKQQQAEQKANRITLSEGQSLYSYNPLTGKNELIAHNAKTYKPAATGTGLSDQLYSGLSTGTASSVRGLVSRFGSEQQVKNFQKVQEGYTQTQQIPNNNVNPSLDQALIYALAKTLDPDSAVREGEYATVQKYSDAWAKQFGKSVSNAALGTGFLTEDARKNIKNSINNAYLSHKKSYSNIENQYIDKVNKLTGRKNGADFIVNYALPSDVQQESPQEPSRPDYVTQEEWDQATPEEKAQLSQ